MEKDLKMYYEPEGEVFGVYYKCEADFFKDTADCDYKIDFEVPDEDLEIQIKITKDGEELKFLVCELSKMSAYNPELMIDVLRIIKKEEIIFSLESGEEKREYSFKLDNEQMRIIKLFMEMD